MKIWYQSCTTVGGDTQWKNYESALNVHLHRIVRPGGQIDIHGVRVSTPSIDRHHYFEYRNSFQVIENAIRAEREGYDVFALGCFLDSGALEVQEIVNIPVVFSCQNSLHLASLLSRKFLILVPNQGLQLRVKEKVRFFGLSERVTDCKVAEFEVPKLQKAFKDIDIIYKELEDKIDSASEAELIVPGDNILNMILVENKIKSIKGIPVMDITGCLVKMAEAMVDMKELQIVERSKSGFTKGIPKGDLETVRKLYQEVR